MNQLNHHVKRVFAYFVEGKPGFWVYDGEVYHWLCLTGVEFKYIRACRCLPDFAYGACVDLTPVTAQALAKTAARWGVGCELFELPDECELAEVQKQHPFYIFGLCLPAGSIELPDSIGRAGEED